MSDPAAIEEAAVRTTADFLTLATRRARAHDPAFPALDLLPLTVASGYCYATSHGSWREGERGANVALTAADIGPAEVIHSEQWSATCWGPGWGFWLRFEEQSGAAPRCWQEPFHGPR